MSGRHHLFVPGPTNIPDRILRAMHRASEDHRSVAFPELLRPLLTRTQSLLGATRSDAFLFPATGTGCWEAALTNTLDPGSRVLIPCAGQFAHLWADTARRLGLEVETFDDLPWGSAAPVARIRERLEQDGNGSVRAVLIVHNETSTGVTSDLAGVRDALDAAGHEALLMVDGVSSIASLPYQHDVWGIDVGLTGSQKGLMLPAGLAIVAFSPKAMAACRVSTGRRAYFDVLQMQGANAQGFFPYTPSIPMLYGLRESLSMLEEEGFDAVFARHAFLAAGVRAAVGAWGLSLACIDPATASNTVSTILLPAGIDGAALIAHAYRRYHLALGGGLGPLAGHAFRVGHLGDLNEGMLLGALGLVEMTLLDSGVPVLGSGVEAAQRVWRGGAA